MRKGPGPEETLRAEPHSLVQEPLGSVSQVCWAWSSPSPQNPDQGCMGAASSFSEPCWMVWWGVGLVVHMKQ